MMTYDDSDSEDTCIRILVGLAGSYTGGPKLKICHCPQTEHVEGRGHFNSSLQLHRGKCHKVRYFWGYSHFPTTFIIFFFVHRLGSKRVHTRLLFSFLLLHTCSLTSLAHSFLVSIMKHDERSPEAKFGRFAATQTPRCRGINPRTHHPKERIFQHIRNKQAADSARCAAQSGNARDLLEVADHEYNASESSFPFRQLPLIPLESLQRS
jgi:hypothetical protein